MAEEYTDLARSLLGEAGVQALQRNSEALRDLAQSRDGQKVRSILEQHGSLEQAVTSGDTEAMRKALSSVLQTQEGQKLARQLGQMFGK